MEELLAALIGGRNIKLAMQQPIRDKLAMQQPIRDKLAMQQPIRDKGRDSSTQSNGSDYREQLRFLVFLSKDFIESLKLRALPPQNNG